jgi:putative N6-adenine-specific DNA methylase
MSTRWYFASTARGLEGVLEAELVALGAVETRVDPGGVSFRGEPPVGRAACLWSRVATRVFEELQRGRVGGADDLYTVAGRVRWDRVLGVDQTFAITARVSGPFVKDARYASLKVKDAIADQFRDAVGRRPDVDTDDPVVPLRVTVKGKVATISRDLAGTSLHKRGYRPALHRSPLNEALAAGLLLLSSWDRTSAITDPMCGSATFLIEAAFIAGDRAPGLTRSFAFERWTDTDTPAWEAEREAAQQRWAVGRRSLPLFQGNDAHPAAIGLARKAAGRAEIEHLLDLQTRDIADYAPADPAPLVVTNPPYGARLGEVEDLADTWFALGRWIKAHAAGGTAWVLSGEPTLTRNLQMRTSARIPVNNGPIACRWLRYDVRSGRS